jgi:hypothetical protein
MTDAEFLQAFEHCSLPESEWTHCAHVRMAWLYLRRGPLAEVLPTVQEGIKRFNSSLNKVLAYHETITQGFLTLIDHRMQCDKSVQTFDEFCARFPDLLDRKLTALLTHYYKETLFSSEARETFLEPDRSPFPNRLSKTSQT